MILCNIADYTEISFALSLFNSDNGQFILEESYSSHLNNFFAVSLFLTP